jgi:chromosome segregation ATPase
VSEGTGAELVGWVRQGERLFGLVLQTLQRHEALQAQADRLEQDNRRLREELDALREELNAFRAERLEAAEAFRSFAEHVTRLATVTIDRLAARRR